METWLMIVVLFVLGANQALMRRRIEKLEDEVENFDIFCHVLDSSIIGNLGPDGLTEHKELKKEMGFAHESVDLDAHEVKR
jgi:hypothetical protein